MPLCKGLAELTIIDVALTRTGQSATHFRSMNSTGREASQADLIRNFVLMGLEPSSPERSMRNIGGDGVGWSEAYSAEFDGFMRHYLTLKTGSIPNVRAVYEAFKAARVP